MFEPFGRTLLRVFADVRVVDGGLETSSDALGVLAYNIFVNMRDEASGHSYSPATMLGVIR